MASRCRANSLDLDPGHVQEDLETNAELASVDLELTLWQEKFDALDSSRHDG